MSPRVTVDRLLSKLGIASRSTARRMIADGRVAVAGRVVFHADVWVMWPKEIVTIDGRPIDLAAKRFCLFHKPKGIITTRSDERQRKTIFDLLPPELSRLHAIGRLDQATSGLLLLTDDTLLSHRLTDPAEKIERRYLVTMRGHLTDAESSAALIGFLDDGEFLQCRSLTMQKRSGRETHIEVVLITGKNREIRRIFAALGHEVTRLRRIGYGPFLLADLASGAWKDIPIADARRSAFPE